ncbi:SDR family NAD(P)-dependent oxidoreductase [Luteolibacter luteus]|uniref:Glucose 1-dehydrogenase n=1 Tax=Luteolibacter luteus TaxID=2728835 RepID=A0A858RBV2_9BACT|nr:glucose 1-dehydrogenase [Luteolibacter luteus]QJE94247.1 glucose 1-dehydrogenase [Luteolibacter luteus]
MKTLTDKVAIVTGASKGIGAAIAKSFAREGAAVVVNYATSSSDADSVVAEITDAGGRAIAIQASVSEPCAVKRLFQETKEAFGKLDVLVNNAGVFKFEPFEAITVAEFQREFSTNVLGTILTIQEAIEQFGFEGGSVINLSSLAGSHSLPQGVLYSATKAAVESITQGLSAELGDRRIRVNAIAPGYTRSEGTVAEGLFGEESVKLYLSLTPLARIGEPVDIARVATFLASDASAWITGETIRVAGGAR